MTFEEVPLEIIDFENETFRISENLDPPGLRSSLKAVGQLYPVVLAVQEGALRIICGFRRLRALRDLGKKFALARVINDETFNPLQAFSLAFWDNLSHREFDPLEKARVLVTLKDICGLGQEELVGTYLSLLGLPPHKNVLYAYLSLHSLHSTLRQMLKDGKITLASAERLAHVDRPTQSVIAALFENVHLSASLQREVLGLIEELSAIMEVGPSDVVGMPEIQALLVQPGMSAHQKGEKLRDLLYRRRNPRLTMATERFVDEKKALNLPDGIRLTPDPYFETPRIHVEFDVSSAERFRAIADAIHEAAERPALEHLFELI